MTNARKIVDILKVIHDHGDEVECHAGHEILMFGVHEKDVPYKDVLVEAGAFWSSEYDCWACWCSA